MILELHERDTEVLEQILSILKNHPEIEKIEVDEEPMVSLPGLEIFPSRRKVFRDRQEIQLTAKEYRILLLLAANKGRVLTYAQIYEQVWGDFTTGNENNTIGFHICNLREKLYRATVVIDHAMPRSTFAPCGKSDTVWMSMNRNSTTIFFRMDVFSLT